ncbi:hypothetical protein Tco_1408832 [Tanacetum coccineum]
MSPRKPPSADSVSCYAQNALHGDYQYLCLRNFMSGSTRKRKMLSQYELASDCAPIRSQRKRRRLNQKEVRGHKKKNEAADEEARLALQ